MEKQDKYNNEVNEYQPLTKAKNNRAKVLI